MKTSKGRDEARAAYVQLGLGYLQQGMTERAKVPLKVVETLETVQRGLDVDRDTLDVDHAESAEVQD